MNLDKNNNLTRIAIPVAEGVLANHFGHSEQFVFFDVNSSEVVSSKTMDPPPHEPGVLPRWLRKESADLIIAGGMGTRALGFFSDYGIKVVVGAPALSPDKIVQLYLDGALKTDRNACDGHQHGQCHHSN